MKIHVKVALFLCLCGAVQAQSAQVVWADGEVTTVVRKPGSTAVKTYRGSRILAAPVVSAASQFVGQTVVAAPVYTPSTVVAAPVVAAPVVIEKRVEVEVEKPVYVDRTVYVDREVPVRRYYRRSWHSRYYDPWCPDCRW